MTKYNESPSIYVHLMPVAEYLANPHHTVRDLLAVGRDAWSSQLPNRSPEEIKHIYDPTDEQKVEQMLRTVTHFKKGRYMAAMVEEPGSSLPAELAGYGAIRQDVSGNLAQRFIKTSIRRRAPYATIPVINVLPKFQRQGIGSALLWGLAISNVVAEHMKPTSYVFSENEPALNFFEKQYGFKKTPADQDPKELEDYFGPNTTPVGQWRLEAPNVIGMQIRALQMIERKDVRVLHT